MVGCMGGISHTKFKKSYGDFWNHNPEKSHMVEVMITPRSVGIMVGILTFFRDRRRHYYHAHFRLVVIAGALTVSFLPLSSTMPHGVRIF
jgi:hypothetical protein